MIRVCPRCARAFEEKVNCCPDDGADTALSEDPRVGQRFGAYRLMGALGRGSMGSVYRAEHEVIGKPVAVKILHPRLMDHPEVRQRFMVEARAASLLRHPGVVDVTDFGTSPDGCPFMVMELLRGTGLNEEVERQGALPALRALPIISQLCRAVHACHRAGVVHRDLKPENIVLLKEAPEASPHSAGASVEPQRDQVKILDFGLASVRAHTARLDRELERRRTVSGSPCFMSPEQALGRTGDSRSDIYSLGVILFEMLTGEVPFMGETPQEVMRCHVSHPVPSMRRMRPDLSIPPEAEHVMHTAMAKRPADRYQSAAALLTAIEACFEDVLQASAEADGALPPRQATAALGSVRDGLFLLRR